MGPNKGLEIVLIIYFDDGETKPGPLNSIDYPSGLGIYRVVSLNVQSIVINFGGPERPLSSYVIL